MEIEELVTRFTADISDYRKSIDDIKKQLHSVSGITESVKEATKNAFSSSSSEMQKLGKQLQSLTEKQRKNIQSAVESTKRIADFKEKARLLVSQLNTQKAEIDRLRDALKKLTTQYKEQKNFIADYDDGIEGIRKQRQEMVDYIHAMEAAGNSAYRTEDIEKYKSAVKRLNDDLRIFDDELKSVGLNPGNLKTDTLKKLEQEMQQLSKQERIYREAVEKTNSQINSTNQNIAIETSRFDELKSKIEENAESISSLSDNMNSLGKSSVSDKLKIGLGSVKTTFGKIASVATGVFSKLKSGFKKVTSLSGNANKSLLNVAKSIRKIGIVTLGLKVCKTIFGQLRSVVSSYLSQNEALNSRIEALKDAFANALAPAINVVVGLFEKLMPYVLSVANAISDLFSSLGIAKSINATATAINGTTSATKELSEAQKDLYGFDQITKVSDNSSGSSSSGGSTNTSTPSASSQFSQYLEQIKELWKTGDFEGVGEQIAASCNKIISKINNLDWDGIQTKVNRTMTGLAGALNGFVNDFDWTGSGEIVGKGLNTITGAVNSFVNTVEWENLGGGIAESLNSTFKKIDGEKLGAALSAPLKIAFETVGGFAENFEWSTFGTTVANMLLGAIKNIKWDKAGKTIHDLITGLCDAISSFCDTLTNDSEEAETVRTAITDFIEGLDFPDIAISVGKMMVSVLKLAITFLQDLHAAIWDSIWTSVCEKHGWKLEGYENITLSSGLTITIPKISFKVGNKDKDSDDDDSLSWWDKLKEKFGVSSPIVAALGTGTGNATVNTIANLKDNFSNTWKTLKPKWDELKDKTKTAKAELSDKFSTAWGKLKTKWNELKNKTKTATATLSDKFSSAWGKLKPKWNELKNKTKTAKAELSDKFSSGWKKIKKTWEGLKDKKATAKLNIEATVQNIKGFINDKIITPINNKIHSIGILKGVSIPKLETGGVLKKGQIGFLEGNGDEAVVPLEKNTGWIAKLAGQIVQLTGGNSGNGSINITLPIYVGNHHLTTVVLEDVDKTTKLSRNIPIRV